MSQAQAATLTVSGPAAAAKGATVTITGSGAAAGEQVRIWFHRKGQPAGYFTARRTLTAGATGGFSTTYVADTDYRYYATTATATSAQALTVIAATTLTGPAAVAPGSTVSMSGTTNVPGSTVQIWFHRKGQAAGYFSLRRTLTADGAGRFGTTYIADTDYRYYAVANGASSPQVLTVVSVTWLTAMNAYRAAYGVAPVVESAALSAADAAHVSYMRNTGDFGHSENPTSPYYTEAGNRAAQHSNVAYGSAAATAVDWIDVWMNGPFHALGVLRPTMRSTGFAAGGGYAALDVRSDLSAPAAGSWPQSFPSARAAFPFRTFDGGEYPDPVAGCPAAFRNTAVSAPLLVSWGPGAAPVSSASVVFGRAGQPAQPVCVVTEGNTCSPGTRAGSPPRARSSPRTTPSSSSRRPRSPAARATPCTSRPTGARGWTSPSARREPERCVVQRSLSDRTEPDGLLRSTSVRRKAALAKAS